MIVARPKQHGAVTNPHLDWTLATGFAYYGPAEWLPLLIELQDSPERMSTAAAFASFVLKPRVEGEGPDWVKDLRVPRFYLNAPTHLGTSPTFISVLARRRFLQAIHRGDAPASSIRRIELGRANLQAGVAQMNGPQRVAHSGGWPGATPAVVTAVIDDGIAFAHDRFFDAGGHTRIEYVWDQQYPSMQWPDLAYGREISRHDPVDGIDKLLADSSHGGRVDEDEFYRRSRQVDATRAGRQPLAFAVSHGTHVADLACNAPLPQLPERPYLPHQPPAPGEGPVIAVQLPTISVEDTSGASLAPQIYNGVYYAIARTNDIAARCGSTKPLPLVVNASYGIFDGPHDGSSLFEQALDELVCLRNAVAPLRVVLPAGNHHLSRCHACFPLVAGQPQTLHWRVLPDDRTESWVEIWLPAGAVPSPVTVALVAPHRVADSGQVAAGSQQPVGIDGQEIARVNHDGPVSASGRSCVTIHLAPTASPDPGIALAPAGLWCIEVRTNAAASPIEVHAWIRRDDPAPGYRRRGRQSYFDDPDYVCFDDGGRPVEADTASYVKRDATLNGLATGKATIVIGGYRRSDRVLARYSASGPVPRPADPAIPGYGGPEALLPSDDTPSHRGVLAAGTRSGSCVAMQGTSVAAPLAARWVAARLGANASSDRSAVFKQADTVDLPASARPPAKRGGGGRIPFPSNRLPR